MNIQNPLLVSVALVLFPLILFSQTNSDPRPINIFEEQARASRNSWSKHRIRESRDVRLEASRQRQPIPLYTSVPEIFEAGNDASLYVNNFPLKSIDPWDFYDGPQAFSLWLLPNGKLKVVSTKRPSSLVIPRPVKIPIETAID